MRRALQESLGDVALPFGKDLGEPIFTNNKIFLESCESTNDVAMDLARQGCPHGTVVIAKRQTRGKGRMGRKWESFDGNLAMSLVIRPELRLDTAFRLVSLSAYATVVALEKHGVQAFIKWPNDILIKSADGECVAKLGPFRKIGGILLEMTGTNARLDSAVIGIGLNLRKPEESEQVLVIPQMGFVDVPVDKFVDDLLLSLEAYLGEAKGEATYLRVLEGVKKKSAFLGQRVQLDSGAKVIQGVMRDWSPDGGLVIEVADGACERIYVGDVSML
jgi:BirA family biotin operon repressor/biotin-[acetyl-CoA-carboxylase] ligase